MTKGETSTDSEHARTNENVPPPPSNQNLDTPTVNNVPPQPDHIPSPHPDQMPSPRPVIVSSAQHQLQRLPSPSQPEPVAVITRAGRILDATDEDVSMDDERMDSPNNDEALDTEAQGNNEIALDVLKDFGESAPARPLAVQSSSSSTNVAADQMEIDPNPYHADNTNLNQVQEGVTQQQPAVEQQTSTAKDTTDEMDIDKENSDEDAIGDDDVGPADTNADFIGKISARIRPTSRPRPQSITIAPHLESVVDKPSITNTHAESVDNPIELRRSTRTLARKDTADASGPTQPSKRKRSKISSKTIQSESENEAEVDDGSSETEDTQSNVSSPELDDWAKVARIFVSSS